MTVCLQDDVPGGGGSLEDEVAKEFLQDQVQQHAKVTTEHITKAFADNAAGVRNKS